MRVAFWLLQDSIRHWSHWIAGLHYVQNCLAALASLPNEDVPSIFAFVPKSLQSKFMEASSEWSSPWLTVVPIEDSWLNDSQGLEKVRQAVADHRCDVYFPLLNPPIVPVEGRVIAWIADYQHKHYPEFFTKEDIAFRDKLFAFLASAADRVVCSSDDVRKDLVSFFPHAQSRAFVLRFTVQPPAGVFEQEPQAVLGKHAIDRPFVYLPYQFWSHKNHRVVFEAWNLLRKRGKEITLVCTGATTDSRNPEHFKSLQSYLQERKLDRLIKILGIVDRSDQWQLYRSAKLVIQPSLFEGWSTSVEEARCLGKTILLSDIPVHREQLGEQGHYFSPRDPELLAKLVERLLETTPDAFDPEGERTAILRNQQRTEAFGRQLIQLFKDACEESREPIASQILPLFTFFQNEAEARLKVIQQLESKLRR